MVFLSVTGGNIIYTSELLHSHLIYIYMILYFRWNKLSFLHIIHFARHRIIHPNIKPNEFHPKFHPLFVIVIFSRLALSTRRPNKKLTTTTTTTKTMLTSNGEKKNPTVFWELIFKKKSPQEFPGPNYRVVPPLSPLLNPRSFFRVPPTKRETAVFAELSGAT